MFVFMSGVKEVKHDVMTYAMIYEFVIIKDWQGIKEMSLCLDVDKTLTVWTSYFSFCDLVIIISIVIVI